MATASASNADDSAANNAPPLSSSYFRKTVCLRDWWLIKSEQDFKGKRLAVAGLTSQEKQAVRAFTSAPILNRSDPLTLETVDGIYVLIDSCLNKVRTEENGFPYEVFSHFVFGFPTNWEEYAENWLEKERSNKDVSSILGRDKLSTDSGTADDISCGTPNRNTAAVSEERHGTSDNMDVNSEEKGHHKPQDDISDGTPDTNKAAFCEERHGTSDKRDVSSEEKGHYIPQDGACNDSSLEGLSLSAGRTLNRSSSKMKSKLKGDPKSVKPVEYEENRLACGSSGKNNMRNGAICGKRTSGRRSTSIPSAVGLQPTDCETVGGNIARQAGKQSKNTSKTLRSCVGLSDANQIDDLKIAGSKKETNVKDASKSREKTKRKLTYESPVTKRGTEKTTFVSPESSSFKRSRSGRLLLPTLEFWRNQLVIYDGDHQITGIQESPRDVEPSRGSRSEPQRMRGKLR
ncbi:kinetochore-associated protein KNL-2 homolog isoform X2 [Rhododendron vialii]|uniref:kinetochore-associated protein KNL-2 homolog isoform X2 n=1 Tax=Rhododendron vialii TaxID=182163 RepID=UPI00265EBD51|nr:kinetochore-associated protein KNL-2 homolog isoform X2 [Rhododendron vialii]